MTNSSIDECYEFARKNGALGGKLIGAGGGGFLMFIRKKRLASVMLCVQRALASCAGGSTFRDCCSFPHVTPPQRPERKTSGCHK